MTAIGLLDGPALAEALHIHPGTIRNWATQGRLTRHGYDDHRRTLYSLEEAETVARLASRTPGNYSQRSTTTVPRSP